MTQDKEEMVPFKRDVMFSCVMRNKKASKELLQLIFPDKKVDKVKYIGDLELDPEAENFELEVQKFLQFNPLDKSIRLDVYFKDSDTIYNIEMQGTNKERILPLRARMYSSLIDANILEKGMEYDKLIDSYVIFVCTFDPFDRGKCIYKFQSICEDEKDLCEGNKRYNIYLNTTGTRDDISFDLKEMFRYINGGETTIGMETESKFVKIIDKYVQEFNANDTWRRGFMKFELMMRDNFKQGEAKGKAEGKAEAEAKAKEKEAQTVKAMYADHVSLDKIAKYVSLTETEVMAIVSAK